jgi:hypothetical protein
MHRVRLGVSMELVELIVVGELTITHSPCIGHHRVGAPRSCRHAVCIADQSLNGIDP